MPYFLKVTAKEGHGPFSSATYSLPVEGKPGEWMSVKGQLIPCKNGFHVCRPRDLYWWLCFQHRVFLVESKGKLILDWNKVVCRSIRFIKELECPSGGSGYDAFYTAELCAYNGIKILNLPRLYQTAYDDFYRKGLWS